MSDACVQARPAEAAGGSIVAATRIRIAIPLVAAVVVIGSTIVASELLGLPLLLGVALTLAVTIAGALVERRALSSLFAGIGLLIIRPYAPGERLLLPSPVDGRLIEAELVRVGIANTTLATPDGLLVTPNSYLLRGAPSEKSMQA
jgi:small-conductance mechanosensitive channel